MMDGAEGTRVRESRLKDGEPGHAAHLVPQAQVVRVLDLVFRDELADGAERVEALQPYGGGQ